MAAAGHQHLVAHRRQLVGGNQRAGYLAHPPAPPVGPGQQEWARAAAIGGVDRGDPGEPREILGVVVRHARQA